MYGRIFQLKCLPDLIVTRPHPDRLVLVLGLGAGVDADAGLNVPDVALGHGVAGDEELGEDGVQIPLEAPASQVLPELLAAAHVAEIARVVPDPVQGEYFVRE